MTAVNNLIIGIRQDLQSQGLPADDESIMRFLATVLIAMSHSTSSGYVRAIPLARVSRPKPKTEPL